MGFVGRDIFTTLRECAEEIGEAVARHRGRGLSGQRDSQYHLDVVADDVALRVLSGAGYRIVSEESGVSGEGEYTIVVDPIDGSTNCDRGIPFYATSLAVVRNNELVAGLVRNQATGTVFEAERGAGATRDGLAIRSSGRAHVAQAIASFSGRPERDLGWSQTRSMGAASLEICLVADGSLDAFAVAQHSTLHTWDFLAGLVIAREAGAVAGDYRDERLDVFETQERRPIVAASNELLEFMRGEGTL